MSSGAVAQNRNGAAVLGAGSWGTALAIHLGSMGHDAALWGRDAALLHAMAERRANPTYLPDVTFPAPVRPTPSLESALAGARHVIVAVPSHGVARRQTHRCGTRAALFRDRITENMLP
jgi:glycerol-3-phosphate dehydrogenase (NAD(P)+)